MKNICLLIFILLTPGLKAEEKEGFIFQEFDKTIIDIWLSEETEDIALYNAVGHLQTQWKVMKPRMAKMKIEHFDMNGFIDDQNARVKIIAEAVFKEKMDQARKEAYILINEFREVRSCFTSEEYRLDYMLDAYDSYLSVHKIIHDPMMELYEWYEFIWFVDQLKCKVELVDLELFEGDPSYNLNDVRSALDRLNTCLTTLDESLGDAYRPDFEIPCHELEGAFKDLFRVFRDKEFI